MVVEKGEFMISIALMFIAIALIFWELHARRKRKLILMYRDIIYTDLETKSLNTESTKVNLIESMVFGTGVTSLTMINILASTKNHSEVLDVLEQRFPHELGSNNYLDWFNKVEELNSNDAITSYVSNFKGQEAENLSVSFLESIGFEDVGLFESLNHADNDIYGYLNGEMHEFSVKTGSTSYIRSEILSNDVSKNYIVNEEAYTELMDSGDLERFADQGISVISPGFSDIELSEEAYSAFDDITESGNLVGNIPVIGIAIFGAKAVNNCRQYLKGYQSKHELGANTLIDGARTITGGAIATVGSQIGSSIGTLIVPGVGTLIGAGIGAVGGYLLGSSIFNKAKERLKWGKIIDAIDHFGLKYIDGFNEQMNLKVKDRFFNYRNLSQLKSEFDHEQVQDEGVFNPYSFKKVTLSKVLRQEFSLNLNIACKEIDRAVNMIGIRLSSICNEVAIDRHPKDISKQDICHRRLLGDVIINNIWLMEGSLDGEEEGLIDGYTQNIIKSPNHPYSLNCNKENLLASVAKECYVASQNSSKINMADYGLFIFIISSILLIVAIYLW